jgi:hypothetical protein
VVLGVAVTTGYTAAQDQTLAIPPSGVVGGLTAAVAIGAIAGLSPAARAARLVPPNPSAPHDAGGLYIPAGLNASTPSPLLASHRLACAISCSWLLAECSV